MTEKCNTYSDTVVLSGNDNGKLWYGIFEYALYVVLGLGFKFNDDPGSRSGISTASPDPANTDIAIHIVPFTIEIAILLVLSCPIAIQALALQHRRTLKSSMPSAVGHRDRVRVRHAHGMYRVPGRR